MTLELELEFFGVLEPTISCARGFGLKSLTAAVFSLQSDGMAESFRKTIRRNL
jgi:hypothetical protein